MSIYLYQHQVDNQLSTLDNGETKSISFRQDFQALDTQPTIHCIHVITAEKIQCQAEFNYRYNYDKYDYSIDC